MPLRHLSTKHPPSTFWCLAAASIAFGFAHAGEVEITLPAALERVTSTDRTVALADSEVRKAITERLRVGLRLKPSISVDAYAGIRGGRTRMEVETLPDLIRERRWIHSDSNSESIGPNLSQPILDLTVKPAQRQSELLSAISQWQLRQRLREVLFEVTALYIEVLRQTQLVEENKKTLTQTAEQVRFAEGRFAAQEVIESDVLQAKVSDEQARRAVMEAEVNRDLAMGRLAITLDYDPATRFSLAPLEPGKALPSGAAAAIEIARQRREEVRVAQIALLRTQAGSDEIKARYLPKVNLSAGADSSGGSDQDRGNGWSAGLSVNWPIWDRGQRQLDLKINGIQQKQDALRIENSLKVIAADVLDAWYAVDRQQRRIASLAAERKAAEENYRLQQGKYAAGLATALEVQTALRDQARVRIEYVAATYSLETALRDLQNVMAAYESPRIEAVLARLAAPRIPKPNAK